MQMPQSAPSGPSRTAKCRQPQLQSCQWSPSRLRAVPGKRVRGVIEAYAEDVSFFVPEVAFAEAEEHLPALVIKRGERSGEKRSLSCTLGRLVEVIGSDVLR